MTTQTPLLADYHAYAIGAYVRTEDGGIVPLSYYEVETVPLRSLPPQMPRPTEPSDPLLGMATVLLVLVPWIIGVVYIVGRITGWWR